LDEQRTNLPILRRGASGPAVFALREHLRQLGHKFGGEPAFGERTEQAVREFQIDRGLRADGICGPQTWTALQEAGYALGDRILAVRHPNVRGDDAASLQQRLGALGFDPGRPDGIFGSQTEAALREFQRIAGDGVCGPATIAALDRLDALAGGSVVEVREREQLEHQPRTIVGRRIALQGDSEQRVVCEAVADALRGCGAEVLFLLGSDDGSAARAANDYGADLMLALREPDPSGQRLSYFGTATFRSVGGHSHSYYLARALEPVLGPEGVAHRSYPILRETKMAAVVVHLGNDERCAVDPRDLCDAIVRGVRSGFESKIVAADQPDCD
jgi:N-acetylmuramoyl-L-alanine amidase